MAYPKKKKTKWEKCADCGLKCSATFPGKDRKKRCVQCNARRNLSGGHRERIP